MHRQFVANGGGKDGVSFTWSVDDRRAVQILAENQVNYAQGTATGNRRSLSVEVCEASNMVWSTVFDNAAKLLAAILTANNLGPVALVQHNAWWGKNCPGRIRSVPGQWDSLVALTRRHIQDLEVRMRNVEIMVNGHKLSGKFLEVFLQKGVENLGYPISEVEDRRYPGIGVLRVQWFERARLELQADGTVTMGLVGVEAREHDKEV